MVYVRHLDCPLTKDVDLKNDPGRLPEEIKFVKFSSIVWTPDSKGFFYQVYLSMTWPLLALLKAYQRYPDTSDTANVNGTIATDGDLDAMIYYHHLGTSQCIFPPQSRSQYSTLTIVSLAEDILIYQDKENRDWMFSVEITEDGKYICFYVMKDSSRVKFLLPLIALDHMFIYSYFSKIYYGLPI